jgi:hypothetical protein
METNMTSPHTYRVTADDWYDDWLRRVLTNSRRRARLARERNERPQDHKLRAEREYDAETRNLLTFIHGQEHT